MTKNVHFQKRKTLKSGVVDTDAVSREPDRLGLVWARSTGTVDVGDGIRLRRGGGVGGGLMEQPVSGHTWEAQPGMSQPLEGPADGASCSQSASKCAHLIQVRTVGFCTYLLSIVVTLSL